MAQYTIDTNLYAKALEELAANWRRKSPRVPESTIQESAETIFSQAWQYATRHHEQYAPQPTKVDLDSPMTARLNAHPDLSPRIREQMAKMRQTIIEGNEKTFEIIKANHRTGLINFFTMDDGVSRATAELIVDKHILTHQK